MNNQFYRLTNELMLEYIYSDEILPVVTTPVYLLKNNYNGSNYFLNADTQKSVTGNVRDNTAVLVNNGEYVSLNVDSSPVYNDRDDNLTNSIDLSITPSEGVIRYDTVKIHILTGFNFENSQGFILELNLLDPFSKSHFLASFLVDKSSVTVEINPKPIITEQRIFNRYITFKIPSLKSIIDNYIINNNDPLNLGNLLTNNKGLTYQQNLSVRYLNINKFEDRNNYRFYRATPENIFTILLEPSFGSLVAVIGEGTDGDYYELTGRYKNEPIENFLLSLNSGSDADWVLFHGVDIIEQIADVGFILTQSYNFLQTENFEQPIFFRPIILNAEWCISWTLEYTLSLYNRATGEKIDKKSKQTFLDPKKWGKSLKKINLNTGNIVLEKLYNKIDNPVYDVKITEVRPLNTVKTVLTFVENYNISVEVRNQFGQDFDGGAVWGMRELNLPLTNTDNFYYFKISKKTSSGASVVNLLSSGRVIFRIVLSTNEIIDIPALQESPLEKGEVIFKINQLISQRAINDIKSHFFIILKTNETESVIYEGKILSSFNVLENNITNLNIRLNSEISELKDDIVELNSQIEVKNSEINELKTDVNYLKELNNLYLRKIELLQNNLDTIQIDSVIRDKTVRVITSEKNLSATNNSNGVAKDINLNTSLGTYRNI